MRISDWSSDGCSSDRGDVRGAEPVLVRMHAINVLDDVLGDGSSGKAGDLQQAMRMVGDAGRGVVVLIREPSADALSVSMQARLDGQPKAGRSDARRVGEGCVGTCRSRGAPDQ